MPKALECANEIFKDSTDSPLAALEAYTNYFVKDFDCEHGPKDKVYLDFYDGVVEKHEVTGRQTFFHGYQRVALDFTKFT